MNIRLDTGILDISVNPTLNRLVGFGSRINKKRGFLFVSKVLGKHIPTKPSKMREIYRELAFKIKPYIIKNRPTLVIGFAETATALGNGVFDSLRDDYGIKDIIYIHSTRFQTSNEIFLSFYEEHCHAPSHIIYKPKNNRLEDLLYDVGNIILVDDEISTGNTANNLINEIKKLLPMVDNYIVTTI
jgi:adenine/guanine phosphoribosyltransferase-like PRPP-binding protein